MSDTTHHIEARSLASLNALAANPPQYPSKPTEERQEPLVLYIARVPGTRDIILSTFKPQIKNVTANDVASSLYYVHLNTPEDELLVSNSRENENSSPRSSLESGRTGNTVNQIPRKPVASAANARSTTHFNPPSIATQPTGDESLIHPALRETGPQLDAMSWPSDRPPPPPPVHRRPVNIRTTTTECLDRALPDAPPPYTPRPGQITIPPSPYAPRPDQIIIPPSPLDAPHPPPRPNHLNVNEPVSCPAPLTPTSRSPSPTKQKPFTPFSLTLIRRDPGTGQQWNVGQVSSQQLVHPEQISDIKHMAYPSINIYLETPGYAKFRGMPMNVGNIDLRDLRESLDVIRPGPGNPSAPVASTGSPSRQRRRQEQTPPTNMSPATAGFERQVQMAYGPSFAANIRNAFRGRTRQKSRDDDIMPVSPGRPGHDRTGSVTSTGSIGSDGGDDSKAPIITTPGHGLRPRGYMFLSPWEGRCEFRTGNGGRSLRCQHVLPSFGAVWNPLVDGANSDGGNGHGHGHHHDAPKKNVKEISELRFNLPSDELFGNDKDKDRLFGPHEGRERRRDRIRNAMINKTESDLEDDEYEALGFDPTSLGREKAGGGNRGKRAKMGKLIVYDEGVKMLDLVVAANVGVWWNVWERKGE